MTNNLKTFLSNLSPEQVKNLKAGIDNLNQNQNQTQGNNGLKAQYEQAIKLSEQRLSGLKQGYEKQFGSAQTTTTTPPQTQPPTQPPIQPQSNNVEINYDALANSLANNETFQTKFKDINNDKVIDNFNDENGGLL